MDEKDKTISLTEEGVDQAAKIISVWKTFPIRKIWKLNHHIMQALKAQ